MSGGPDLTPPWEAIGLDADGLRVAYRDVSLVLAGGVVYALHLPVSWGPMRVDLFHDAIGGLLIAAGAFRIARIRTGVAPRAAMGFVAAVGVVVMLVGFAQQWPGPAPDLIGNAAVFTMVVSVVLALPLFCWAADRSFRLAGLEGLAGKIGEYCVPVPMIVWGNLLIFALVDGLWPAAVESPWGVPVLAGIGLGVVWGTWRLAVTWKRHSRWVEESIARWEGPREPEEGAGMSRSSGGSDPA